MNIRDFLVSREVWFETLLHRPVPSASRRAQTVHVPGRQVAKGVLVRAGESYVLAVLPSTTRIDTERLSQVLDGLPVALATEDEVEQVFGDCERGALPPFGRLYGVRTIVDASLAAGAEIVCVGNLYINRKITGALVDRQPFGGFKLSGIGTKAGGTDYLLEFLLTRTVTENTMRRGFAPETETAAIEA
jgi:prolyl-tRNA editing enzyme YbaK/EbsC (Cys-tRNA(Pro) deacylase)